MSNQVVVSMFGAASVRSGSADAELIGLARELLGRVKRMHRCDAGLMTMTDAEYEREAELVHEGGRALMAVQPTTMEGLVAKAQVVRVQFERLVACDYHGAGAGETHERLAWSVLNDLLGLMGGLDELPSFARGISAVLPARAAAG